MTVRVEYLEEEPSGLATMLGGLIEANLEANPDRAELLRPALVGILAEDAGVANTLRLAPGRVTVADGLVGRPQLVVRTDSETLMELSAAPLRLGLPDALSPEGRAILGKLRSGRLRVRGMLLHPGLLSRLNRLLSVA